MEVKQVYELVNQTTSEILGETATALNEDLTNVVDIGEAIFGANAVDRYVKSLVNHIGRVIFVDRAYRGSAPSVMMDGWEFGSVLEKISCDIPEAEVNESWDLTDGASYDPNVFHAPKVSAKFFNKRITFEVDMSFTEMQVKQSFSNASQLNAFISMIYNAVDKSLTVKIDSLVMATINNMTAETLFSEYPEADYTSKSGVRAVNLLKKYNTVTGKSVTADKALTDPEFIRYASMTMANYIDRMSRLSTLFNVGGKPRFTSRDLLHVVMLSDFKNAANSYLQSDTFHDEYTALPNAESVPFWQASGNDYAFAHTSDIDITTPDQHAVHAAGILAVMFDRDALGVANLDRRVTSNYNPKGEFYTNFYKFDAGYFNDLTENYVVFFIA